jgi:NADH-quinone oxidoreductase subunit C
MSTRNLITVAPVPAAQWLAVLTQMRADGYRYLDYLAAVDRIGEIQLIAHVLDPGTGAHQLMSTTVHSPGGRIDSITGLFAGANWHEREAAEMFGIEFTGHPDPRPLLLRNATEHPPMLRSTELQARVETMWPGDSR